MGFMRGEGGAGGSGVPTLTASRAVVTNGSGALAAATTTAAEIGYLNGVTSAVQTQLNGKAATSHTHNISDVNSLTSELASKAPLDSPELTGTPTSPTPNAFDDSDRIATTAMVQDAIANAVTGLIELKGSLNASGLPNYPSAEKGDAYTISVAGRVGGASGKTVEVGDVIVATADNAGGLEASVGTSWTVWQANLVGALLGSNNLSDLASAATARTNLGLGTAAVEAATVFPILAPSSSGRNTIQPAGAAIVAAVLKWFNSSHSADLLRCTKDDDTILLKITAGGAIIGSAVVPSANYQPLFQLVAAGSQPGNFSITGGDVGVSIASYGRLALNDGTTISGRQLLLYPGTTGGLYLGNAGQMVRWGDTYTISGWDAGLGRTSAGEVETNTGTAGVIAAHRSFRKQNAQTGTTYTFVLTDGGRFVSLSNASAVTVTVPPNADVAFPIGTEIDLAQLGAGTVTVAAGSGVTIRSKGGLLSLGGQYAGATLKKLDTNEWLLVGDLA